MSSRRDKLRALPAHRVAYLQRDESSASVPSIDIIPSPTDIGTSNVAIRVGPEELLATSVQGHVMTGPLNRLCDVIDSHNPDIHLGSEDDVPLHERPWHKRPSPWWLLPILGITTCLTSMTFVPKTEIFIRLVCEAYMPEIALSPVHLRIDHGTSPIIMPLNFHMPTVPDNGTQFLGAQIRVPRPTSQCRADPVVGRRVAALGTMVSLTLGVLSCITTGFWSKISDTKGRTWVLKFCVLGAVLSDINFILVTLQSLRNVGSYNLFLLSSIFDGLAGGAVTSAAASYAYLSDCVDPTIRTRIFSLYSGIYSVGTAVGPMLGGLIISQTDDLLVPFYAAMAGHIFYFIVMFFFIPESLSKWRMALTRERKKAEDEVNEEELAQSSHQMRVRLVRRIQSLFKFMAPLAAFAPADRSIHGGIIQRDWNLTYIAGSTACVSLVVGSLQFKFQYAAALFNWGSEEIGYWLSAVGIVRGFHLIFFFPLITKMFGPECASLRNQDVALDDPTRPLLPRSNRFERATAPSRNNSLAPSDSAHLNVRHSQRNAAFDLRAATWSLIIIVISFVMTCFAFEPKTFTIVTILSSFGTGCAPAIESLALSLMPNGSEDAGKLFGSFAIVKTLTSLISGPAIFGATYIATVSWFPQAILWLSVVFVLIALMFLSFIRLPMHNHMVAP